MNANRLRTGIFLIGIGVIFLGNTLGYLEWFVWSDLLRLWPMILIAIGIEMVFKRSSLSFFSYLSPLLIAACFIYVIYDGGAVAEKGISTEIRQATFSVSNEEASGLDSLKIDLDLSLGDFDIESTNEAAFTGEIEFYNKEPKFKFSKEEGIGKISLDYDHNSRKFRMRQGKGCHSTIFITDKVPLELSIDAGVVDLAVDLSNIQLARLDMDSGDSDVMIRFGDKSDHIKANFDIGVSDLSVYIPEGTAVRLHRDTGLASVSYRDLGLVKVSKETYESPNYGTAERTIDIEVDAGISDINLEYYDSGRGKI